MSQDSGERWKEVQHWLGEAAVGKLWPVRADRLVAAASRADVRYRQLGGESRGSYGANATYYRFHPEDVQRAAVDIAEGRIPIPPEWRTDTAEGQQAERWERTKSTITCLVIVVLVVIPLMVAFVYGLVH
jgi:hypothetical protein